jgi:hypothetical protein
MFGEKKLSEKKKKEVSNRTAISLLVRADITKHLISHQN